MKLYFGHRNEPPMFGMGIVGTVTKMLCNRCPLKHEVRDKGSEMLYENAFEPNITVRRLASKNTTDISDT